MKEKYRGLKHKRTLPVRNVRYHDLEAMRGFTGKPIESLADEALGVYLANFMTSPEYQDWCDEIERKIDEWRDRDLDYGDLFDL